ARAQGYEKDSIDRRDVSLIILKRGHFSLSSTLVVYQGTISRKEAELAKQFTADSLQAPRLCARCVFLTFDDA
ncbi:MAG: hypothetical protein KDA72_19480, partial [Planctomycetales bacterium]|nr:hypothetical protein [Planctomycetales bacterium]